MLNFSLVEARPDSTWAVEAYHELDAGYSLERFGEDLSASTERTRTFLAGEDTGLRLLLLAIEGPAPATPVGRLGVPLAPAEPVTVLGAAIFTLPTTDNEHLVDDLFVTVGPAGRRRGVGSALVGQVRRIAVSRGRTTLLTWSEHLATPETLALPQLPAPTGSGSVPTDAAALFLRAVGFELAQVERWSRLDLPTPPGLLDRLAAAAEAAADGAYRVESWRGRVPQEHLDAVARLYRAMSTDAPVGGIDFREEEWDAARVGNNDDELLLNGDLVQTIAVSRADEEVAGITVLFVPRASPHRPEQGTTVVLPAHRGHRLGVWMKAANLRLLEAEFAQARHIDTWNADENDHMLSINTAIGFRLHGVTGAWQMRIVPGASATGTDESRGARRQPGDEQMRIVPGASATGTDESRGARRQPGDQQASTA